MNRPDLIQARFFRRTEFTVERDGVTIQSKSPLQSQKIHVPFENIPPKSQELSGGSGKLLTASAIFSVLTAVCALVAVFGSEKGAWIGVLFWGAVAAIVWGLFVFSKRSLILFAQNGGGLVLQANSPSASAVEAFLTRMFMFRKDYLLKRYGQFDDAESYESKLARLNLLREQEVLTEQEYQFRRKDLGSIKGSPGRLGFAP